MIKAAIDRILTLGKPETFDANGRLYFQNGNPVFEPTHPMVTVNTLTGFIDYLKSDFDGLNTSNMCIHVASHALVRAIGHVSGPFLQRDIYASATLIEPINPFIPGRWYDHESFIITLQASFELCDTLPAILALVGNLKDEKVKQVSDDGITQTVTARAGIARIENVDVPNPVTLYPYRTFLEADQPAVKFIFRMRSGKEGCLPECALFEGDGGLWKLQAIQNIKNYLIEHLPGFTIIA